MKNLIKKLLCEYHSAPNCDGIQGSETVKELIDFLFSDGFGYCIERHFPSIGLWREFNEKFDLRQYGVYVDAGAISLHNGKKIALVGDTQANVRCDEIEVYRIIALHGATADVTAEGSAMVCIRHGEDCSVSKTKKDRGKFL